MFKMSKEKKNDNEEIKDTEEIISEEEEISEEVEAEETEALEEEAPSEPTAEDKLAELENRYLMLSAEYDNFRKRTAKEKEALYADAVADVSSKWLDIIDNIDRAIDSSKDINENNYEQIAQGIELIGKGAGDILTKLGIEEIECERGTDFDPNLHEAVMHIEDEELGEQQVSQVFKKGYIYKDKVIRHTVVQVAN